MQSGSARWLSFPWCGSSVLGLPLPAGATGREARGRAAGAGAVATKPLAGLAIILVLSGCGMQGDFGRHHHQPPLPELAFVGDQFAKGRSELVSGYRWSDDERLLRAAAFNFLKPAGEDEMVGSAISEVRLARILPLRSRMSYPTNYYASLGLPHPRSSTTIWSRLIDDINNDATMIEPFAATAYRVALADRSRYDAYRENCRLETSDLADVPARISENHRLVAGVRIALIDRLNAYAYAIEKGKLELPDPREHIAYQATQDLRQRLTFIEQVLAVYEDGIVQPVSKSAIGGPACRPLMVTAQGARPISELPPTYRRY